MEEKSREKGDVGCEGGIDKVKENRREWGSFLHVKGCEGKEKEKKGEKKIGLCGGKRSR